MHLRFESNLHSYCPADTEIELCMFCERIDVLHCEVKPQNITEPFPKIQCSESIEPIFIDYFFTSQPRAILVCYSVLFQSSRTADPEG